MRFYASDGMCIKKQNGVSSKQTKHERFECFAADAILFLLQFYQWVRHIQSQIELIGSTNSLFTVGSSRARATHVNPCGTFILQRQQRKYVPWTHYGFWFHVDWININFNDTCVVEAIKLALDVMPNERRNFFVFNYSIFFLLWWLQHMCIVFKSVTKYNKTTILFCFEFIGPLQESINSYICTRYESINWNMISCWNICYYCFSKIRSWIGHVASNYMSIYR